MSANLRHIAARAAVLALVLIGSACGAKGPIAPDPPPVATVALTCPTLVDRDSADGAPVAVSYVVPQATGGAPPLTTTCSVPSGNSFAVGSTMVSCQARDSAGRTAACSFTVAVHGPPQLQFRRFLAFGDSLTEGTISFGPTILAVDGPQSYPSVLRRMLLARYQVQKPEVVNEGFGGEEAALGGIARFRGALLSNRPEVVLLMEGTNDLLSGNSGSARALSALDAMMREAENQNIRVCLATIPPQRPGFRRGAVPALIPGFNNEVRALAARRNAVLIDVYDGMKDDLSLIGVDDLHMTPRGYEVMANIFYNSIKGAFERTTLSSSLGRWR